MTMPDPIIDRAAIIEAAARTQFLNLGGYSWAELVEDYPATADAYREDAESVLRVITPAILAPLRELHTPREARERLPNGVSIRWQACSCGFRTHSACPTVQALDAIEAAVKGGE